MYHPLAQWKDKCVFCWFRARETRVKDAMLTAMNAKGAVESELTFRGEVVCLELERKKNLIKPMRMGI